MGRPWFSFELRFLTYASSIVFSLFQLASTDLEPGALVALFRGSHLSVLYKSADPERPGLYTLVTDQIFAQEPSVVSMSSSSSLCLTKPTQGVGAPRGR
jgi:hypothetical protein